jgi:hypothetical protein
MSCSPYRQPRVREFRTAPRLLANLGRSGSSRGYRLDAARREGLLGGLPICPTQFAGGTLGCTLRAGAAFHPIWYDVLRGRPESPLRQHITTAFVKRAMIGF